MDAIVSHSTSVSNLHHAKNEGVISISPEIEEIHKAAAKGMKIGLVIGREVDQPVPQQEGWLWVSGNLDGAPAILENRVHLQMDFNKDETCEKLHGLFDQVVVDTETLKFMSKPWSRFVSLLKVEPTSQLITERLHAVTLDPKASEFRVDPESGTSYFTQEMMDREWEQEDEFYDEWESACSDEQWAALSEEFLSQKSPEDREYYEAKEEEFYNDFRRHILDTFLPERFQCIPEARRLGIEAIKDYLPTLFENVELVENHPYPTREGFDLSKESYFVLTGPKSE